MIDEFPEYPGDLGWHMYPTENGDVLESLSPEARALCMKVMQQCHKEHPDTECNECDDMGIIEHANVGFYHCYQDSPDPFICECGEAAFKFEDRDRYGHKWGPENVKLTWVSKMMPDGSKNKLGHDLYFEVIYTAGSKHEWLASYGVNSDSGEISCYAD